jgi:arylsulfatase A-like enzyme
MVRLPSGKHAVSDAVVQFPDLLPTLLELLGLPETYAYPLAGRSFARVLENPAGGAQEVRGRRLLRGRG